VAWGIIALALAVEFGVMLAGQEPLRGGKCLQRLASRDRPEAPLA
jgi:hypothetical protein